MMRARFAGDGRKVSRFTVVMAAMVMVACALAGCHSGSGGSGGPEVLSKKFPGSPAGGVKPGK